MGTEAKPSNRGSSNETASHVPIAVMARPREKFDQMDAYLEAVTEADPERKKVLHGQLLAYCRLDTYAMVCLGQAFAGRHDVQL